MPSDEAVLDLSRRSRRAQEFHDKLSASIVGQAEAVDVLSNLFQVFVADLLPRHRPVGALLFLGPTGSGKTRVAECAAESLFGDPTALIKVDCAEFQHAHDIAKLIGSPPGYVGHRETAPLLTQENLDRHHRPGLKLSLVVFDEIEKASDALWQLLLGILDRATLKLGDNRSVDFSRTLVTMTSNLGAHEMSEIISGRLGFAPPRDRSATDDDQVRQQLHRAGVDAARRRFSPEFMNRIDKIVVFAPLGEQELRKILDLELNAVQDRLLGRKGPRFLFECTGPAKDHLLAEGTDARYGARHLKRTIERRVVLPLSTLVASQQVREGDLVEVSLDPANGELVFSRRATGRPVRDDRAGRDETEASDRNLEETATRLAVVTAVAMTAAVVKLMDGPLANRG
jgi:ATP-dependent Clp protease ATP-binding subunit ClpB